MLLMYDIKKAIKSKKDLVYYTNHPPTQIYAVSYVGRSKAFTTALLSQNYEQLVLATSVSVYQNNIHLNLI